MYLGQAQRIEDRHSVFRTGTAYRGQVRRIEDNHIVLRKSTAHRGQAQRIRDRRGGLKTKNPISLASGTKHGGPTGEFNRNVLFKGKIFVYTHSDSYLNLKKRKI